MRVTPFGTTCLLMLTLLAACRPAAGDTPAGPVSPGDPAIPVESATPADSATPVDSATPTPEVFIPLDPSPSPSGSTLPMTCQVTDLNVYVDRAAGYCFAYPSHFTLGDQPSDSPPVLGPALDDSLDPVRVSLEIKTEPAPEGSALTVLVDDYLTRPELHPSGFPWTIERSSTVLGGEPAERLEDVPGRLSSRLVMALHENTLFTLRFHPSDAAVAGADLEALFQTVTGSFVFLD